MGMAFDPDFNNTHYIYVTYTYNNATSGVQPDLRTKLTRLTYEAATNTIGNPMDLITSLSGSTDHNSGHMTFGQDGPCRPSKRAQLHQLAICEALALSSRSDMSITVLIMLKR